MLAVVPGALLLALPDGALNFIRNRATVKRSPFLRRHRSRLIDPAASAEVVVGIFCGKAGAGVTLCSGGAYSPLRATCSIPITPVIG
jgi:hypothetical protein